MKTEKEYLNYKIIIEDSTIFKLDNMKIRHLKLIVEGQGKGYKAIAYNNYLLNISNPDNVSIYHETGFYQPECGTSDYNFKSIGKFVLNNKTYFAVEKQENISCCCGASKEELIHLLIFNNNYFDKLIKDIITYHKNYNNDDCGEIKPAVTETTKIYSFQNQLVSITQRKIENQDELSIDTLFYEID